LADRIKIYMTKSDLLKLDMIKVDMLPGGVFYATFTHCWYEFPILTARIVFHLYENKINHWYTSAQFFPAKDVFVHSRLKTVLENQMTKTFGVLLKYRMGF